MEFNCCNLKWMKSPSYSWLILFFAAANVIFLGGKRRAFGGFIAELHKEFPNVTLTELNWIGDSYSALGSLTSVLSTAVIFHFDRRYGLFQVFSAVFILLSCVTSAMVPNPHWLFVTHTLLHGVGSSLVLTIAGLIVLEYFDVTHPYHILATTLISGGSIASIIFVSLFAYVIQVFKWRMAFLIFGLAYFVVHLSAAFFFRRSEDACLTNKRKFMIKFRGLKRAHIWLLLLWFLDKILASVVLYGLLLNLTDYLYRGQTNLLKSTLLTTVFASGEGLSYLITAIVTATTKSFLHGKMGIILIASSAIASISLTAMEFTDKIVSLQQCLCFFTGCAIGFSNTLLIPAAEEMMKLPGYVAYPFSLVGLGVGMLLSPVLTALLAEKLQYRWFFLIQGMLMAVKIVFLCIMMVILWYCKRCGASFEYEDVTAIKEEIEVNTNAEEEGSETSRLIER